jgi:hypothetical protein
MMYVSANEKAVPLNLHRYTAEVEAEVEAEVDLPPSLVTWRPGWKSTRNAAYPSRGPCRQAPGTAVLGIIESINRSLRCFAFRHNWKSLKSSLRS